MLTEGNILAQTKKGQGETNERLDRVIFELDQMNQNLEKLIEHLARTVKA